MREKLAEVARIAANQHGVIRLDQLLRAGLTRSAISRRVRAGQLHRLHRGVYAVGHANLSNKGRILAAVFACGKDAVASHQSAAYLWSLSPKCPPLVHVTIPDRGSRARRQGIVLHRSSTLRPSEITKKHNIPLTKPERTRQDLGWDRRPTRSELERLFLRVCRAHDMPLPETNVKIGPHTVDALWREERLVVEVDSYAYHSDRETFAADRKRDRYLQARGFHTARISDDELEHTPAAAALSLHALLRRRRDAAYSRKSHQRS
jgi:very-short-patch-repair endonuclease